MKNGFKTQETEVERATEMEEESKQRGFPEGIQQEQHTYANGNGLGNGYANGVNGMDGYKPEPVAPSRNF